MKDFNDYGDIFAITLDLHSETGDISWEVSEQTITIYIQKNGRQKRKNIIMLPYPVIPEKTKVTYVNGILDFECQKADKITSG